MLLNWALAFYFLSFVSWFFAFLYKKDWIDFLANSFLQIAILGHSIFLGMHIAANLKYTLAGPFEVVSLLLLFISVVYLILLQKYELKYQLGFYLIIPLFFLIGVLDLALAPLSDKIPLHTGNFHAILSVLALSFSTISFISSCLYLKMESRLKAKDFGFWFNRLSPLGVLKEIGYKSTLLGFLFLTITILSGFIFQHRLGNSLFKLGPREILIFVSWLVYALYFHIRFSFGTLGRKLAFIALVSYLIQVLAIFTMVGIHRF